MDIVIEMAKSEMVMTVPNTLEVYVDDTCLHGPDCDEVDRQGVALEEWCGDFGVHFKRVKVKPAARVPLSSDPVQSFKVLKTNRVDPPARDSQSLIMS